MFPLLPRVKVFYFLLRVPVKLHNFDKIPFLEIYPLSNSGIWLYGGGRRGERLILLRSLGRMVECNRSIFVSIKCTKLKVLNNKSILAPLNPPLTKDCKILVFLKSTFLVQLVCKRGFLKSLFRVFTGSVGRNYNEAFCSVCWR